MPPLVAGFALSALADASWAITRTEAPGTTSPDWSVTVTTTRPRRGWAWADAEWADPATTIAASTPQARRRIYFATWNFFASIFGFTLMVSKTISSVGLPSTERWIVWGNWTPPTLL